MIPEQDEIFSLKNDLKKVIEENNSLKIKLMKLEWKVQSQDDIVEMLLELIVKLEEKKLEALT